MLRFAPSPTEDMNIESLRVALFNYIFSVQKNEGLVIRIEDTDKEKNIEGKDQEIIGLLDLFGIKYTNIMYQSDNVKHHQTMALSLLHEKIAFNCFCTTTVLAAKKEKALRDNQTYYYDDACLSLRPEETIDNENPFRVRLRKPNVDVEFTDAIKGELSYSLNDLDSFIILRTDKSPTYNFACAIDDLLADISMVIRSENYLSDTPKQIAARAALNYTKEIQYVHLPIILDYAGKKINKDDKSSNVKWLLEEGFLPAAMINYLLSIGNTPPQEIFSIDEALKWFDLSTISKTPAVFDIEELRVINNKHLNLLDDVELSRYVGFADADIGKLAKLYLKEVSTTKELKVKIGAIFSEKTIAENLEKEAFEIKKIIQNAPFFKNFDGFESYIMEKSSIKREVLSKVLRLLLTGMEQGPAIADMYPFLKNYLPEVVK